jgi:hypothetical protein
MAPTAHRIAFNPNDHDQSLTLWTDGTIRAHGGALNPMLVDTPPFTAFPGDDTGPVVAFQVIDWNDPSGYSLDFFGGIHPWGPSGQIPAAPSPPPTYYGPGLPRIVVDFWMDPSGSGAGYNLLVTGTINAGGGAPALSQGGPALDPDIARRLVMRPGALGAGRDYYVMDAFGARHNRNGAVAIGGSPYFPGVSIARALVITDWVNGDGYLMDGYGNVYALGDAQPAQGGQEWPGWDIARDMAVVDNGDDPLFPLRVSKLDGNGGRNIFVVSKPPNVIAGGIGSAFPADPTTTTTRPRLTWAYKDPENDAQRRFEFLVFAESYVTANFQSEVQTLVRDTTDAGGTFKLRFGGALTPAIAQNANAATVQAALDALWGVPAGAIVASGTLSGTNTMTLTYNGHVRVNRVRQPVIVPQNMTGGTRIIATRTQAGTDPWAHRDNAIMDRVGNESDRRFYDPTFDLANGGYRMVIRVKDTSDQWSPTSGHVWLQSVTRPTAPTLTATDMGGAGGIELAIGYGSPPANSQLLVEFSDDAGVTWEEIRYFDPVTLEPPTVALPTALIDTEAPFHRLRSYRAFTYIADPFLASNPSTTATATLSAGTPPVAYLLHPIDRPDLVMEIDAVPPYDFSRGAGGGSFQGAGQRFPVNVRDGAPRGPKGPLKVRLDGEVVIEAFDAVIATAQTLLCRDTHGRVTYFSIMGDIDYTQPLAPAPASEQANGHPVRYWYDPVTIPYVSEARPPSVLPAPFVTPAV